MDRERLGITLGGLVLTGVIAWSAAETGVFVVAVVVAIGLIVWGFWPKITGRWPRLSNAKKEAMAAAWRWLITLRPAWPLQHPEPDDEETEAAPVATETVDRFREVYESCRKASEFAYDLVTLQVATPLTCLPESQNFNSTEQAVGRLVERYVLPDYYEAQAKCDEIVRMEELDEDDLHLAKRALHDCLCEYRNLLHWLNEGSQIVGGQEFFGRPGYTTLRQRHQACLAELERVKVRQDLQMRQLADHHRSALRNVLRPPPTEKT